MKPTEELEAVKAFRDMMEKAGRLSSAVAECIDNVIAEIEEEVIQYDVCDSDNDELVTCVDDKIPFEFPQEIR